MAKVMLLLVAFMAMLLRDVLASWKAAALERYGASPQASAGVRRFSHIEKHDLKDGAVLALQWTIDADPAALLSIDVEKEHGVQMLQCQPDRLVLQLPAGHVKRIEAFQHIVASRHVHQCSHLQGEHLYHRVVRVGVVKHQLPPLAGADVTFTTKELASASEVVPYASFSFRFTPAEAKRGGQGQRRLEESRCIDMVDGWEDLSGRNCSTYATREYCTSSGDYGKGWHGGNFAHVAGSKFSIAANDACCACGGGRSPGLKVVAIPVYFAHNPKCRKEARDFGTVTDVNKCAALVASESNCSEHFVFDGKEPRGAGPGRCRCCDEEGGWGKHTMKPIWTLWRSVTLEEENKALQDAGHAAPTAAVKASAAVTRVNHVAHVNHEAHRSPEEPKCVDIVAGWEDALGRNCSTYQRLRYCTGSGDFGVGWHFGTFAHFMGSKLSLAADDACCACGGGRSPTDKVLAIPVYFAHHPQCSKEARDFGRVANVTACAELVVADTNCGEHFVFDGKEIDERLGASTHRVEGPGRCRCCDAKGGWDKHTEKPIWTLWRAIKVEANQGKIYSAPAGVDQALDQQNIFNFVPRQVANFGWNWDFKNKKVKESQFRLEFPGGTGYVEFTKPSVRVHAGLVVNFTSHSSDSRAPDVRLLLSLEGHAFIEGDMAALIDVNKSEEGHLALPFLDKFRETTHLDPLEFFLGSIPVSLVPGVRLGINAHHAGQLQGTMRVGVEAHLLVKVNLDYDSQKGLHSDVSASTVDVQFWPPTWLVSSKQFDVGALLEPEVWLTGSVGDIRNAKLGLTMRSYLNMSVDQDTDEEAGKPTKRRLAVYPFRAVGLPPGEEYAVQVSVDGKETSTSTQLSFGVVEYSDHVENFDFGLMTEDELLMLPIKVSLLRKGEEEVVASAEVTCDSLVNGECHPSPVQAVLHVEDQLVVVQLSVLWQVDPLAWISNKIRSISIGFNSVLLAPAMSAKVADAADQDQMIALLVKRNGRKFGARVEVNASDRKAVILHSNITYDFGLCFLEAWRVHSSVADSEQVTDLLTPSLQLVLDGEVVGENSLPPMDWSQSTVVSKDSAGTDVFDSEGDKQAKQGDFGNIPISVALYNSNKETIGTSRIDIGVNSKDAASYFVYPNEAEELPKHAHHELSWTVDAPRDKILNFTLGAMEVGDKLDFVPVSFIKQIEQACSDRHADVKKYISKPFNACTFETSVEVGQELAGRRIVFTMKWSYGGREHVMISAPVDCSGGESAHGGRGLASESRLPTRKLDESDQLTVNESHIDFDAKMKELNPKCSEQPLKYSIKVGLLARTEISRVRLPSGLEAFGGAKEIPETASAWQKIQCSEAMYKLNELLMAGSCEDNRCDGTLPACKPGAMPVEEIPRLRIQLSREFDWTNESLANVRKIFAYGLAILPEVLDIIVMKAEDNATARSEVPADHVMNHSQRGGKAETHKAVHKRRRLDAGMRSDDFIVSFRESLPFRLDGPLVEALLVREAWRGISDGREAKLGLATIRRYLLVPHQAANPEAPHAGSDAVGLSDAVALAAARSSLRVKSGQLPSVGEDVAPAASLSPNPLGAVFTLVLSLLLVLGLLTGFQLMRASSSRERYEEVDSELERCE